MIKKAQSILECVILMCWIILAVVVAALPGGPINRAINNMFANALSAMH
jgi:hypothetical protein